MFVAVAERAEARVTVTFEGRPVEIRAGLSLAAGLLEAGVTWFRAAPVSGGRRAPYCMMGVCFDCLLVVDGMPNCQACMMAARDGMVIARQPAESDDATMARAGAPTGPLDEA